VLSTAIKRWIKKSARLCGAEIVSRTTLDLWERQSLPGVLRQLTKLRIDINAVIDVGAAHGWWSLGCAEILPGARYLLVEPLEEYRAHLEASVAQLDSAEYVLNGLDRTPGSRMIHVHPDLVGSSFYLEDEDSDVNGVPRSIPTETLDHLVEAHRLEPPFLLKLDVQGAELDVLQGGLQTLQRAEFVILESSFLHLYENKTTVFEIMQGMRDFGFAPYDVFGLTYRPLDGALAQADICFVREDGPFREHHYYATRAQRERQTERFRRMNAGFGPQPPA